MDFEDFYGRYVDRVSSYVLRHTSLRDAEDIVAETFTVAWRKRVEKLADPMPWLIVTARNNADDRAAARDCAQRDADSLAIPVLAPAVPLSCGPGS